MLEYSLHENPLTERTDDFAAQPHVKNFYKRDDLINMMLQRGTLVTKTDAVAVLNAFEETICYVVSNGGAVSMPLMNTGFSIGGSFNGAMDAFDPARHRVKLNLTAGIALREAAAKVKPRKVQTAEVAPVILEVKDVVSGSVDDRLTAGSVVQITGSRLKFIAEDTTNGVFLVQDDGNVLRLDVYADNRPARIMAMLPAALTAGEYHLEVRTNYANGKNTRTQTTKAGRFHKILTAG